VDLSKNFKTGNLAANFEGMTGRGQAFKKETERLLAAGDTEGLQAHFDSVTGQNAYKPYISAISAGLDKANAVPGSGNPIEEGRLREEFQPGIDAVYDEQRQGVDDQLASDEAIRAETGALNDDLNASRDERGDRIEGLQDEAGALHDQFAGDSKALSEQALAIPEQVNQKYDAAISQTMARVDSAQALLDGKEAAASAEVFRGRSSAMASAVQGIQGNINNQIASIQGDPNMTASQKQTLIAQVKMNGMMQIAPAVGTTILGFNDLAARTSVAFGQMTTQIQGQGIQSMEALSGAGAQAFANTSVAATQMATSILNMQQQSDSSYITNMTNLESVRGTLDMAGDSLRAQLLPGLGIPFANYADPMMQHAASSFELVKSEFAAMVGQANSDMQGWIAATTTSNAQWAGLREIGTAVGGPAGVAATLVSTIAPVLNSTPPPAMPGQSGYTPSSGRNWWES